MSYKGKNRRSSKSECRSQCKDSAKSAEVLFTKLVEVLSRLGSQEGTKAADDGQASGCSGHEVYGSNLMNNDNRRKMLLFTPIFKCVICSDLLQDPVQCPHCAHAFCRACCCRRLVSDFLNPGGSATGIKISCCPVCKNFVRASGFVPGTFVKHSQRTIEFMYEVFRNRLRKMHLKSGGEACVSEGSASRPAKTVEVPEPFRPSEKIKMTETGPRKSANKVSLDRIAELTYVNTTKVVTTRRKGKRVCSQHPNETIEYFCRKYCLLMCEKCLSLSNLERWLVSNVNGAYKTIVSVLSRCSDHLKDIGELLYQGLGRKLIGPREHAMRDLELQVSVMRTSYAVKEMIRKLGKYELLNMSRTLVDIVTLQFKEIEKRKDASDCRRNSSTDFSNLAESLQSVTKSLEVPCAASDEDDMDTENSSESEDSDGAD